MINISKLEAPINVNDNNNNDLTIRLIYRWCWYKYQTVLSSSSLYLFSFQLEMRSPIRYSLVNYPFQGIPSLIMYSLLNWIITFDSSERKQYFFCAYQNLDNIWNEREEPNQLSHTTGARIVVCGSINEKPHNFTNNNNTYFFKTYLVNLVCYLSQLMNSNLVCSYYTAMN